MTNPIRRALAALLCLTLIFSSSGALAAAKVSKIFTQKPTLKAAFDENSRPYSGTLCPYTVTASLPGFLTVRLTTEDGAEVMVLENHVEIHSQKNSFEFYTNDASGNMLPAGKYALVLDMVSQYGVAAKTLTKAFKVREPLDASASSAIPAGSGMMGVSGAPATSAAVGTGLAPAASGAIGTGMAPSVVAPAQPAAPSAVMTYAAGESVMGDEGLLIGVGVSDTATQADAGYWGLTADATDAQIWAALTRRLTGVDVAENESAYIYDSVLEGRKRLGTVSGIAQGVNVVAERSDGWSLVEAFRNEDGAFIRGYIRTNKLRTSDPNTTYGLVIDKKTQMLYVYKDGARVGSCRVSTGLPTGKYPHRETPAGEFIAVTRRGVTEYYGNGYSKYTIRVNGNYHLSEIPTTKKNGSNYSILEAQLGAKATRGNICIAHEASADGGINAEWIWNMTDKNKRVKVLIFDDKPRTDVPVSSK